MTEKLDEKALRKPTYRGGVPIRLLDGQEWHFAKPVVDFGLDGDGAFRVFAEVGDPAYHAAFEEFQQADPGTDTIKAAVKMCSLLLLVNYDLSFAQLSKILRFQWVADCNPEAYRIKEEAMAVALGHGPKPSNDLPDLP